MFASPFDTNLVKTTSYRVVLPFYAYAAIAFLVATVLLLFSEAHFLGHYFQFNILAITHSMALGWGTMIILGASHQLVPVLIEGELYSNRLAYISFVLAGLGIPILVYSFFMHEFGLTAEVGGSLVFAGLLAYFINITFSVLRSKKRNSHTVFIFTSIVWLLITVGLGLLLIFDFRYSFLMYDATHYLPLHAHFGIVGWFLLLVMGVGSRLIPMFMISKYANKKLLGVICFLVNIGVVTYTFIFLYFNTIKWLLFLPVVLILTGCVMFIYYCIKAYKQRLRRRVDYQTQFAILAAIMFLIPIVLLFVILFSSMLYSEVPLSVVLTYGFMIFFGWMTAIILGMTFKTLPFIAWNKAYRKRSARGKTPNPKDLFSEKIFNLMGVSYLIGLFIFAVGIMLGLILLMKIGAVLLLITAVLYNMNVFKVMNHKPIEL
ncbi:MAG: cytochrome C oxidase subunit I [Bacteroidia bacterium]|nr:cytochrome C oxidase subunit I [Bacteroidia bacterium]